MIPGSSKEPMVSRGRTDFKAWQVNFIRQRPNDKSGQRRTLLFVTWHSIYVTWFSVVSASRYMGLENPLIGTNHLLQRKVVGH